MMPRRTPEIRKKRLGRAETSLKKQCGSIIHCHHCGYAGLADVLLSTVLHTGGIERCPHCKTVDFKVFPESDILIEELILLTRTNHEI